MNSLIEIYLLYFDFLMIIAITGANGFIGSNLAKALESKEIDVRRIQRTYGEAKKNVFLIEDLVNNNDWQRILKDVHTLVHCAAITHDEANQNNDNYQLFENVNVRAFESLIEQSVKSNVRKIIFISSVKVNGEFSPEGKAFRSDSICNPSGYYGLSKLKAEVLLQKLALKNNISFVIIRPPLVYGPGVKANFYQLIKIINNKFPIPLASISNLRSYIYIDNLISFICECIKNDSSNGKIFLVSDKSPLSTPDLIREIADALGVKPRLFTIPPGLLNFFSKLIKKKSKLNKLTSSLVIDPKEAYSTLNWEPPFSTKEGIKSTIKWFTSKN
tara:strand:- start:6636 stop:7625 length:990 start_codon:yes stop_codon:yes gene_type:complete